MPEIVGSAYVRIRAITADLAKDIKDGVNKGSADADLDRSGQDMGDSMVGGMRKSMKKGMKDAVNDSTKDLHKSTDVHKHGESTGSQFINGFKSGFKKGLPSLKKEFTGGIRGVIMAALPLTYSFVSLAIPILAQAVNLVAQYAISVVAQIGFLATAAVGGAAAIGGLFMAAGAGVAVLLLALKTVTPELEAFRELAKGVGKEWQDTAKDFQKELLPALGDALISTKKLIPAFRAFGISVSRDVGNAVRDASDAIFNNVSLMDRLGAALGTSSDQAGTAASVVDNLARALGAIAPILVELFVHLMPLADRLSESIRVLSERFAWWFATIAGSGELDAKLTLWYDRARLLGEGLGDFFLGIWNVLQIGADAAAPFFTTFNDFAERFRAFTESTEGQNRIKEIFEKAIPLAQEIHRLVRDIITAIADPIFDSDTEGLVGFVRTLRLVFLPLVEANIAHLIETLGPPLAALAESLGELFVEMSKSGSMEATLGILRLFVETLTLLLQIPGFDQFLTTLLGLASVLKTISLLGKFTGVTALFDGIVKMTGQTTKIGLLSSVLGTLATAFTTIAAGFGFVGVGGLIAFGGIVLGIIAVVALAAFLIVKHWDTIKKAFSAAIDWIVDHWKVLLFAIPLIGPIIALILIHFNTLKDVAVKVFNILKDVFVTVWHIIVAVLKVAWAVMKTVFEAIVGFITDTLIPIFGSIWHVIQTVWDIVTKVIVGAWHIIGGIFRAIVGIITDILLPIWEDIWFAVQGAWNAITTIIVFAFQVIRGIFILIAGLIITVLVAAFNFLWPIVQKAWDLILAAIQIAWQVIQVIFNLIAWTITNILVPIFQFLWEKIQWVWDMITGAISAAWDWIKGIWDGIIVFIQTKLFPIFQWLWDKIKEVWEGIKSAISTAWEFIKGVFSGIWDWIDSHILQAFRDLATGLGGIWDGIKSAMGTVWDSIVGVIERAINGGIKAINKIIDAINVVVGIIPGVSTIGHIPLLLAEGGTTGGRPTRGGAFARGGIPAPYNLGKNGPFITSGIRAIVGEGRRAYPEYVIPTDPAFKGRARRLFVALGSDLGVFPGGKGARRRRGQSHFLFGGILGDAWDTIKDIGAEVAHGAASALYQPINQIARGLINEIPWELLRTVLHGVRKGIANWVGGEDVKLGDIHGAVGGGPNAAGLVGWARTYLGIWKAMFPDMTIGGWRATGSVPGSDHPLGKALDLMTGSGAVAEQIIRTFMGQTGAKYFIWNRQIATALSGWVRRAYRGPSPHTDHVHLSYLRRGGVLSGTTGNMRIPIFDNGGILRPGVNLVANNTGRPEFLRPDGGSTVIFSAGAVQVQLPEGVTPAQGQIIGRQIGRGINEVLADRQARLDTRLGGGR